MAQSKTSRLLAALRSGRELTAAQITAQFGLTNPTAAVANLRARERVAIYANKRTTRRGTVTKYRVGTPTARMARSGFTS